MGDRSLILQISNHHAAACGTPPRVEERSGQYLGYFEDKQHVYPLSLAPPPSPLAPSPRPNTSVPPSFGRLRTSPGHAAPVHRADQAGRNHRCRVVHPIGSAHCLCACAPLCPLSRKML